MSNTACARALAIWAVCAAAVLGTGDAHAYTAPDPVCESAQAVGNDLYCVSERAGRIAVAVTHDGKTWRRTSGTGLPSPTPEHVVLSARGVAGSDALVLVIGRAVFGSRDHGDTWKLVAELSAERPAELADATVSAAGALRLASSSFTVAPGGATVFGDTAVVGRADINTVASYAERVFLASDGAGSALVFGHEISSSQPVTAGRVMVQACTSYLACEGVPRVLPETRLLDAVRVPGDGGFAAIVSDDAGSSRLLVTDSAGGTWIERPLPPGARAPLSQARLAISADRRLWALRYRQRDQSSAVAVSFDAGRTWTWARPLPRSRCESASTDSAAGRVLALRGRVAVLTGVCDRGGAKPVLFWPAGRPA